MYIETTINIHQNHLKFIEFLAEHEGVSRSCIIKRLLKRSLTSYTFINKCGLRVKYQKQSVIPDWHRFHISFTFSEYELFKDIPKVCKFSLAHFLALAIEKYIQDSSSYQNISLTYTDNYRYPCYIFISETIDGIQSWRIFWGMPGKIP